jgi:hypothetical protein
LDSGSPDCWITRFETWVVTQAKSPATCLDSGFPNCQICLKLRFETSFKFRFPKSSQNYFISGPVRVPSLNKVSPTFNPWFSKHMPHRKMRTWRRTSEGRTDFRSARSELEEKAEAGKMEF